MEEIKPTGELANLLELFKKIRGVIDFALIKPANWKISDHQLHQEAAIFTLQTIEKRRLDYFRNLVSPKYPDVPVSNYTLTYDLTKIEGKPIRVSQFLGPYFDFKTKRLLLRGISKDYLNSYFYAGDEEKDENIVNPKQRKGGEYITEGFAQAFTKPPYGLDRKNLSSLELNKLFLSIIVQLFDIFSGKTVIFQWSDDWSSYFDAGKEWWGSFLWTVHNTTQNYMVGVAASTTD
jgi:hypothetical protein